MATYYLTKYKIGKATHMACSNFVLISDDGNFVILKDGIGNITAIIPSKNFIVSTLEVDEG